MLALDSRIIQEHMRKVIDMARRYDDMEPALDLLADKLASDLETAAMSQWQAELYDWQQSLSDQEVA